MSLILVILPDYAESLQHLIAESAYFCLCVHSCCTGVLLYKLADLLSSGSQATPSLTLETGCKPVHIAFNCDGSLLSICIAQSVPMFFIYNILNPQVRILV